MTSLQQCSICHSKYNLNFYKSGGRKSEANPPRLLICGHSFCERCVSNRLLHESEDLADDESYIICPFTHCKKRTDFVAGDISQLPYNKYLIGSAYITANVRLKKQNSNTGKSDSGKTKTLVERQCANCVYIEAVLICVKCDQVPLCEKCFSEIHKQPILSGHQPQPLTESEETDSHRFQVTDKCSEHIDNKVEYFCKDCSVAHCAECGILGSHTGHDLQRLRDANLSKKLDLELIRQQITTALALSQQSKKRLDVQKGCEGADDHFSNPAIARIEEVFQMMHSLLQLKQIELEDKVKGSTNSNSDVIKNIEEDLQTNTQNFEYCLEELDQMLSDEEYEKRYDFTNIIDSVQQLLKLPCHLVINDLSNCSQVKVEVDEAKFADVCDLVNISVQTPTSDRFALVSLDCVPEDEVKCCPPPLQKIQKKQSVREPPVGMQNNQSGSTVSLNCNGISQSNSLTGSVSLLSRKSSINSSRHQYQQQLPPPPPMSPVSSLGDYDQDMFSLHSNGSQRISTSSMDSDLCVRYDPMNGRHVVNPPTTYMPSQYGAQDLRIRASPFCQKPNTFNKPAVTNFQNHELVARQARHELGMQQMQMVTGHGDFRHQDIRVLDPFYANSDTFAVLREGLRPPRSIQMGFPFQAPQKPVGRGRAKSAPVSAPPGTSYSNNSQSSSKRLYMKPPSLIQEKKTQVNVSHIESPNVLYIQERSRLKTLQKLESKIKDYCLSQSPVLDLYGVKYLFAFHKEAWRRGEVIQVYDRSARIFFPDYGFSENINSSNLRNATKGLLSQPSVAVKCYLQGIQPADGSDDWSPAAAQLMFAVLKHDKCVNMIRLNNSAEEQNHLPIDLIVGDANSHCCLSLRDYLVFTETAVWDCPNSPFVPDSRALRQIFLTKAPINEADNLKIFISYPENPHKMYAQIVHKDSHDISSEKRADSEILKLDEISKSMQEKYTQLNSQLTHKVYVPKPGMPVAALFDDGWYRAQVISLQPGLVKVFYVDYGNSALVKPDDIRVLSNDFKQLPAQAVIFSVYGVAPLNGTWSQQICKGMIELFGDKVATAKAITGSLSEQGLQLHVTMNDTKENIADVLVENGLAARTSEELTEHEGVECHCTHVESPGEFYVQPLNVIPKLESMTSTLNNIMSNETEFVSHDWQVNDNCVIKQNLNWVRAIIECIKDDGTCKLRVIDFGYTVNKPKDCLRRPPEAASCVALATVCYIAGIIPAGGSSWSMTAKDLLQELLIDKERFKVIAMGQALDMLPCDVIIGEELPSKVSGKQGEIQYVSVKERLLEAGVALREMNPVQKQTVKPSVPSHSHEQITHEQITHKRPAAQNIAIKVSVSHSTTEQVTSEHPAAPISSANNSKINLVKSPDGTIRGELVETNESASYDPTKELLNAAAAALVKVDNSSTPSETPSAFDLEGSSSSDLPTPELCDQLFKYTNISAD